ncbi:uncharacterized protein LOC129922650 [Biomphalaria glabrata]|uniref:Uncharacterized protein LOC129922650 n=1 Tax=Biomphalaria glabrata TaxID=6526 RepID=A0A9W2YRA7_BIOGL|nr:uncharacterized protein LOC129922650 [Biomphalaria glabrata]
MPIPKAKMMMMIIALISFDAACSGLQINLKLADLDMNYTQCSKGLLSTDKFMLIGNITNFNLNQYANGNILLMSKNKNNITDQKPLKTLFIDKDCNKTKPSEITCVISIDKKEIITKFTESASKEYNNVYVFLRLFYMWSFEDSSEVQLPQSYEPNNTAVFVNDQVLSNNNTAIIVENSTLHFRCPEEPSPCEVFIYINESLVKSNLTSLVLKDVDIENNVYRFVTKVCNSKIQTTYTPCLIDNCKRKSRVLSDTKDTKGVSLAIALIPSLIIGFCVGKHRLGKFK